MVALIEPLRKDKQIGSSLQARVVLTATAAELAFLERHLPDLPMLFIVSEVELRAASSDGVPHGEDQPQITIARAHGVRCERCWRVLPEVGRQPDHADLCRRCAGVVDAYGGAATLVSAG